MQRFIPDTFPVVKRGSGDAVNQRRIPRDTVVLITAPQNVPVVKRGSLGGLNCSLCGKPTKSATFDA